jgi:hypothetical protein
MGLWSLIYLFTTAAFAVNWHRRILQNEPFESTKLFWAKGPVFAYLLGGFLVALAIFVVAIVPAFLFALLSVLVGHGLGVPDKMFVYPVAVVIGCWIAVLFTRMALCLVGTALDERREGPFSILAYSKGMFWKVFGVLFLSNGPLKLASGLIGLLAKAHALPLFVLAALAVGVNWVTVTIAVGVLTTLYGVLVQGKVFLGGELVATQPASRPDDLFNRWKASFDEETRNLAPSESVPAVVTIKAKPNKGKRVSVAKNGKTKTRKKAVSPRKSAAKRKPPGKPSKKRT